MHSRFPERRRRFDGLRALPLFSKRLTSKPEGTQSRPPCLVEDVTFSLQLLDVL